MIKYICDKCKQEVTELYKIQLSLNRVDAPSTYNHLDAVGHYCEKCLEPFLDIRKYGQYCRLQPDKTFDDVLREYVSEIVQDCVTQ